MKRPEGQGAGSSPASALFAAVLNLSRYHREHEKFYAAAPLQSALEMQGAARVLKTLADRWGVVEPQEAAVRGRYLGAEDLNEASTIQAHGVLFMEGEGEPPELLRLKRDLAILADDYEETGTWLSEAMQASWEVASALVAHGGLADVLGERHRIIANDWQAACLNLLVARLLRRALDLLANVDFSPAALRADLQGQRVTPHFLYSASELIDRAADLSCEGAMLVHDNERRWRIFRERVAALAMEETTQGAQGTTD